MNRNSKINKKPAVKPLEDMNVLDNFLFTELAGSPEFREQFGRIILSVFLQRKLGKITVHAQSVFQGDSPVLRGVRLDVEVKEYLDEAANGMTVEDEEDTKDLSEKADYRVYDMEAQIRKVRALPKRSRFYQAKLDGKYLESGEKSWNMLPDLYVIMITSYDPFGYDYMMYTIHNQCKEVPELEYEDGVTYLYFYTGGKKGGNEEIKSLLTYLQSSIIENVKDEATRSIHASVEKIKRSAEVRGKYMTVGEMMDYYKELGYEEGREEGAIAFCVSLLKDGFISLTDAAKRLRMSEEELQKYLKRAMQMSEKITLSD